MTDAWIAAREAARGAGVELQPLTSVEDAERLNDVVVETWGGQRLDREVIRRARDKRERAVGGVR